MLLVTARHGACGENSTQTTARVSTLTVLGQKKRVRDSGDSRVGAIILPVAFDGHVRTEDGVREAAFAGLRSD